MANETVITYRPMITAAKVDGRPGGYSNCVVAVPKIGVLNKNSSRRLASDDVVKCGVIGRRFGVCTALAAVAEDDAVKLGGRLGCILSDTNASPVSGCRNGSNTIPIRIATNGIVSGRREHNRQVRIATHHDSTTDVHIRVFVGKLQRHPGIDSQSCTGGNCNVPVDPVRIADYV
jgi:hypothetical protein